MKNNNSNLKNVIRLLVLMVIAFVIWKFSGDIAFAIHKDRVVTSTEALGNMVTSDLEKGNKRGTFYLKNIDEDKLSTINEYLDGFFGSVKSYTVLRTYDKYTSKVELTFEVSDNYYVYRAYKYGDNISDKGDKANELLEATKNVLDSTVNISMTDYEKELSIHNYLVTHSTYGFLSGEDVDQSYKAYGTLVKHMSVCNGYAEAMQLLLMCCDIDSYMVTGEAGDEAHAWNLVNLEGSWYHIDTTWDDPVPDRGEVITYAYVNLDDSSMAYDHTWNMKAYPKSSDMKYNYYNMTSMTFENEETAVSYLVTKINNDKPSNISVMIKDCDKDSVNLGALVTCNGVNTLSWSGIQGNGYLIVDIELKYK